MNNSLENWALNLLQQNSQNNAPFANQAIQAIRSGDNATGERIARNICQSYGVSEQEALSMAKKFFGIR